MQLDSLSKTEEELIGQLKTPAGLIPHVSRNIQRKLRVYRVLRQSGVDCDSTEFFRDVGRLAGVSDFRQCIRLVSYAVELKWDVVARLCKHYKVDVRGVCTPEDSPGTNSLMKDEHLLPETKDLILPIDKALREMGPAERCKTVSRIKSGVFGICC